jgi:hypothetical protein
MATPKKKRLPYNYVLTVRIDRFKHAARYGSGKLVRSLKMGVTAREASNLYKAFKLAADKLHRTRG